MGPILATITESGLRVVALKMLRLTRSQAEGFYGVHRARPFFAELTTWMASGPVVAMILEGEGAIGRWRDPMGPTPAHLFLLKVKSPQLSWDFTLALCEISAKDLPPYYIAMYPRHNLPAVRLARLAISLRHQGKGYGALLVAEAVHRTILIADQAGSIGLFVDAKNDRAGDFYKQYGLVSLPGQSKTLFLPLKTLRAARKA